MEKYKQHINVKNGLILLYALLLLGAFFFVRSALSEDGLKIDKKESVEEKIKVKPVKVTLIIDDGGRKQEYNIRMENTNSVLELLDRQRSEGDLKYERLAYRYGTEIEHIDYDYADENQSWLVFMTLEEDKVNDNFRNLKVDPEDQQIYKGAIDNRSEITLDIETISLVDNGIYEFVLTQKEEQ